MTVTEKKEAKTGSRTNLNESTLPLLEDPEKGKGEKIELENKGDVVVEEATDGKKKVKEPRKERTSPFVAAANFTAGLNVVDRDDRKINNHVNLNFEDILAESEVTQGFEFIWRLTFIIFTHIRLWLYRIVAGILAIPLAFIWAIFFAFINVFVIWFITPVLRIYDVILHHVHRVWAGLVRTFLDPIFTSFGLLFSNIRQSKVESSVV